MDLWLLCQCRFVLGKKQSTILASYVNNGGSYICVGAEGMWEISVLFTQFCCKPKIKPAIKIKY